jgi:hypothetical protein
MMVAIQDYQRRRVAALFQLLDGYRVPKEVFGSHCGCIDVIGVNFTDSVHSARWNAADMQGIVDWM